MGKLRRLVMAIVFLGKQTILLQVELKTKAYNLRAHCLFMFL